MIMRQFKILIGDTDEPFEIRVPAIGVEAYLAPVKLTSLDGNDFGFDLEVEVAQSGTAGYTAQLINVTETSTGSGTKLFNDWRIGGVSVASLDNEGNFSGNNLNIALWNAALQNVVEDETPQLGGDLDFNSKKATSFKSTGIDDNATRSSVEVTNENTFFGEGASSVTYHLGLKAPTGQSYISLGSDDEILTGSSILLYSASHSVAAYDLEFYANGNQELKYDHSESLWDAKANNIITTGGALFSATYNNQSGGTYTIQASDNGKILTFSVECAITLPDTLATNFHCTIVQVGAGVPTVTPDTDTINGAGTGVAPTAQWQGLYLSQYSATNWLAIL